MVEVLRQGSIGGLKIHRPIEEEHHLKILVYGDPGVGKTVFGASACEVPALSPVLVIDMEGGDLSLARTHPSVDVVRVKSFNEFSAIYAALKTGNQPYKTLVLDSITEIQKFGMYEVMRRMLLDPKNSDRDPDMPGIAEWGKNTEQIRKLTRAFRDLPMNVVITALATNDMSDSGIIRKSKPALSNKLSFEIPGFFDIVGYMYVRERKIPYTDPQEVEQVRNLLTMATQKHVAKDRTGVLPPVLQSPTMKSVYDIIQLVDDDNKESGTA